MSSFPFLAKRHSVRKFKDQPVPKDDILKLLEAATLAPSGKNKQNWHFVVITNKDKIHHIAQLVAEKNASLAALHTDPEKKKSIQSSAAYHTIFKNAPVLILIYAGHYDSIGDGLREAGVISTEEFHALVRPNPGVQNIAAAMENLQLAAADLGYGGCWMTGPTYAAREISEYLGFEKPGYYLAALTPMGIPADDKLSSPPRKPGADVATFIE